jgi:hypothetical protein
VFPLSTFNKRANKKEGAIQTFKLQAALHHGITILALIKIEFSNW